MLLKSLLVDRLDLREDYKEEGDGFVSRPRASAEDGMPSGYLLRQRNSPTMRKVRSSLLVVSNGSQVVTMRLPAAKFS